MRLLILLVFLFGCTTVEAPIVTTAGPETGGEGGGPPETSTDAATGTGGEGGSGGATSTTSGTAGSGGEAGGTPELGACLGYDEGLLASCKQPIDAGGCEALFGEDGTFSDVCPTANLVGCCRRAQEYTCYYSPEFNDDMATYCESDAGGNGTWEAP